MVWIGDGFPSIIVWKEENRYTFGIFQIVGMFNRRNTICHNSFRNSIPYHP